MRKLLILFGIALFAIGFVGCDKDDDDEGIEIYTEAGEGGTLSITTEDGQNAEQKKFKLGDKVIVTATPDSGYYFSQWSDGDTDNPRIFEITPYFELGAFFLPEDSLPEDIVIDLGLPSGTLWATCNLGATNPWDYGTYYAWGETIIKDAYNWSAYNYCNGSNSSLTKYCNNASYGKDGYTDAFTTLEAADDAATAVLGSDYSMPTDADWSELTSECYWVWTTNYKSKGTSGYIVYKPKDVSDKGKHIFRGDTPSASYLPSDAHIFLPAAGCFNGYSLFGDGSYGCYWSSTLDKNQTDHACRLYFKSNFLNYSDTTNYFRCCGQTIRPIKRSTN